MDREHSLDDDEEGTCLLRLAEVRWADSLPPWGLPQQQQASRIAPPRAGGHVPAASPPPSPLLMRLSASRATADVSERHHGGPTLTADVFPRLGSSPRTSRTNFLHA